MRYDEGWRSDQPSWRLWLLAAIALQVREAALPQHLKPVESAEDRELSALLNDDHRAEPPRQRTYEDPTEMHKRPLSEGHAVAAVKALPLPDEDETPPEPD